MKHALLGLALATVTPLAYGAEGDLSLMYNVYTHHFLKDTYLSLDHEVKKYEEDNNLVGLRYGVNDFVNVGYATGTNSYGQETHMFAAELVRNNHPNFEMGMAIGMANGYERISSNGWTFAGGPFLRGKTEYVDVTVMAYAMSAITVTVDVSLGNVLKK